MVQFNLLPSVKLEYIKAVRMKRTVTSVAIIVSAVALGILALLFINVNVVQKQHINNLTEDIDNKVAELEQIEDIDKVLTVQNQLESLTALHEEKPATERVLPFLSKMTPQQVSISQARVSFVDDTFSINGTADSLATVNKFIDTIKFTKYKVGADGQESAAFSEVVLASFSVDKEEATFQIDFKFAPEIFDNTQQVELVVPSIISTRSQTEKPSDLFQAPPAATEGQ
jgi:hypothetical protein